MNVLALNQYLQSLKPNISIFVQNSFSHNSTNNILKVIIREGLPPFHWDRVILLGISHRCKYFFGIHSTNEEA